MNDIYCNNCGKQGHIYNQCKVPITSYGVIAFRYNLEKNNQIEYLMIRRKNSLGFLDFMRGKYNVQNKQYILNMFRQMTIHEKEDIKTKNFDELWRILWSIPPSTIIENIKNNVIEINTPIQYKNEELSSKDKFNMLKNGIYLTGHHNEKNNNYNRPYFKSYIKRDYNLNPFFSQKKMHSSIELSNRNIQLNHFNEHHIPSQFNFLKGNYEREDHHKYIKNTNNKFFSIFSIIDECYEFEQWTEPEWGFPKGRRNYQEKDYDTAMREFSEETGYNSKYLKNIQNIFPFEEIFIGSNYKSYKHKYYLMHISYLDSLHPNNFETTEVSKIEWKNYDDCINSIRSYNLEKKRLITNIHHLLNKYNVLYNS
jgi:8-oxo-dGTP pyrophosphatase MutT (NUDIX family)